MADESRADDDRADEGRADEGRADEGREIDLASEPPIVQHVAKLSDRAIQRVTGGNAFLRGRLYARRKSVEHLVAEGSSVSGEITVRSVEEPYRTRVELADEGKLASSCTCPGWRGPSNHCKHVAAVLVALRDRFRPAKAKPQPAQQPAQPPQSAAKKNGAAAAATVHTPQTVSVGGKRRRSRRRRRGEAGKLDLPAGREPVVESRGSLDAWLPPDALPRPLDIEYRLVVRPAAITLTAVLAGTRTPVSVQDALSSFNMVPTQERALLRALARHVNRGKPSTAELRAEDAAEVISMLRGRKVLIEPSSMELRYVDEPLRPHLELDRSGSDAVRIRVVFVSESNGRRFPLSSGTWFEGTPGWHLDVTEGVARPLAESVTPAWLQRLYRSPALVHPLSDLPRLLTDYLPRISTVLGAPLPELEGVVDVVDAEPHFRLTVNGDLIDASVRLRVAYEDELFEIPPNRMPAPLAFLPPAPGSERPRVVRRDVGAEMVGIQKLLDLGFEVGESGDDLVVEGDRAIEFWTEGLGTLPEEWDRFIPDDLVDVTIRDASVSPRLRVSSGVDWLSLDMSFDADGIVVSEEELRACLEHGRHLVKLKDGTYAPVDPQEVGEVLTRMAEILASAGSKKKLPLSQAGRVQDLVDLLGGSASVASDTKSLFGKIQDIGAIENVPKPRTLKATLRPYQKAGYSWLAFLHGIGSGGILADDMGLGKTLQAISLLLWAKAKEKRGLSLVIAPTSVVPNWAREIEKFGPSLTTVVWQGPDRMKLEKELEKADVMITSYALLRRDEELLKKLELRYVILDEAQHIKNPLSQTARAAKKLNSERRLALTGTPIENRLSEIWSIFDFVSPGLLGSLQHFEEKIARPINAGDDDAAKRLRATIQPFVLRRTKGEVAKDLPEKIEQEIVVPLADAQATLYKQVLQQVRKSVLSEVEKQGVSKAQIQILAALTRLRQVACDPRLMQIEGREFSDEDSGKLGALKEIVSEAVEGGHRVLVFSQFVQMLSHIRAMLEADGVAYEYLDGSTKDRLEKVDSFNQDESIPVFLISLKAGGTGLNLTGADTVVHFDPWWNPAVEDQATDRAHRIGQTKVVNVYRLVAENTVEEKILRLSAKKRALMENVLSVEGSPIKGLTQADVDTLFSDD